MVITRSIHRSRILALRKRSAARIIQRLIRRRQSQHIIQNVMQDFQSPQNDWFHEDGSEYSLNRPQYRPNDHCKRHALPDSRPKTINVDSYRRRK